MKAGAKRKYDASKLDAILASLTKAQGSLGQVADLNYIPRETFYGWLRAGDADLAEGLCTELGQFSGSIRNEQANVLLDMVAIAFIDDKRSKFIMWWLSRVCREDFGAEGMEIRELRDLFRVIVPLLGKGMNIHGQDTEENGNKAEEAQV